jgi:hypothetical protein
MNTPLLVALRAHPGLVLAWAIYLILAGCYFFMTPIFEAPDEWTHTGHVKYIAEGNGLPVMLPGQGIWGGQQPPLYYAIGALLVQPFKLTEFDDFLKNAKNPHASLGYALDPGNKNNFLHTSTENFPYHGLTLTVHVLRLYSMIYGLITIFFVYLTAFEFYKPQFLLSQQNPTTNYQLPITSLQNTPHLFATLVALLVTCQPMFAFITASVANEPANIAFCALGLWLAQRYVLFGPTPHWRQAVALGLTLGLISLSKMTGLAFALVVVVALLITTLAMRKTPGAAWLIWRDSLIIGLLFLLVGGWWYWRNYQLYGDFFQRGLYKLYFNVDPQPLNLSQFLYTLSTGEVSFWATFGWLNIVAPEWVYTVYRTLSRIGLLGLGLAALIRLGCWLLKGKLVSWQAGNQLNSQITKLPILHPPSSSLQPSALILHFTFPIALAFSLTRLVAIEGGLQGRQLLPALGAAAIVITAGWWLLLPGRLRGPGLAILSLALFGLALWLPFGVVAPEYYPKPLLTEANLPGDLTRLDWSYQAEMQLLGVTIGSSLARPGERVPVTAYWQALKPIETNYSIFVHLVGRDNTIIGQFNTYPGLGLRPTRTLQPGQIVADTYPVLIAGGSPAPTRLLVKVGLFDFKAPGRPGIAALDAAGQPVGPTVGQLKLVPNAWPAAPSTPLAQFADTIQLAGYEWRGCQTTATACELSLTWLAGATPAADYTVFIQLWQNGEQVTGFDSQPLRGDYPTSLWAKGEVIIDPHPLTLTTLAPGEYQIWVGLYQLTTGDRLPAFSQGVALPNVAVDLGILSLKK